MQNNSPQMNQKLWMRVTLPFHPDIAYLFLDTRLTEKFKKVYVDMYPQYSYFQRVVKITLIHATSM